MSIGSSVSIPYRFNERPRRIIRAWRKLVSIPYRFNESLIRNPPFVITLEFQFLIGSMKEVDEAGRLYQETEFQFLIGSMKGFNRISEKAATLSFNSL